VYLRLHAFPAARTTLARCRAGKAKEICEAGAASALAVMVMPMNPPLGGELWLRGAEPLTEICRPW